MRTGRTIVAGLLLASLGVTGSVVPSPAFAAGAATASPAAISAALAAPAAQGMRVRSLGGARALANSKAEFVHGTRIEAGGCSFKAPTLRLAPGENAIESRQVGINLENCTTLWEIGTPTDVTTPAAAKTQAAPEGTLTKAALPSSKGGRPPSPAPGGVTTMSYSGSGSGYFKAWQTDIINITVNSVQTNISWSWNAGCTQSGSGSTNYNWTSASGWEPAYNKGSWISRICDYAHVWSQADYQNTGFCWPNTVHSRYRGIAVAGWFDGGFAGSSDENSHWGNGGCAPLWDNQQLIRVT